MKKILLLSVLLFATIVEAKKQIGPAGCGLGNVMFGKDSQILAATTNGSSGTQTFGISSGTSNCVDSTGTAKLESYIEANTVALANDIARGNGETLTGLTQVLHCNNPEQVHSLLKNNYRSLYKNGSTNSTYISSEVRVLLKNNRSQSKGCQG